MNKSICVVPCSSPFVTKADEAMVGALSKDYAKVIIAVKYNLNIMLSIECMSELLEEIYSGYDNVKVVLHGALSDIEIAKAHQATRVYYLKRDAEQHDAAQRWKQFKEDESVDLVLFDKLPSYIPGQDFKAKQLTGKAWWYWLQKWDVMNDANCQMLSKYFLREIFVGSCLSLTSSSKVGRIAKEVLHDDLLHQPGYVLHSLEILQFIATYVREARSCKISPVSRAFLNYTVLARGLDRSLFSHYLALLGWQEKQQHAEPGLWSAYETLEENEKSMPNGNQPMDREGLKAVLHDAFWSVAALEEEVYRHFVLQVEKHYTDYQENPYELDDFRALRFKFLERCLEQEHLFVTDFARTKLEERARENIKKEMKQLEGWLDKQYSIRKMK